MLDDGVALAAPSGVQSGAERKSRCGVLEHLHRDEFARVVQEFRRFTRNLHEAQDLAQETFLRVCEAIVRGCVRDPVGYLWVAVRNRARNWARDSREHLLLQDVGRPLTSPRSRISAEAGMLAEATRHALVRGIRRLSPGERDVYGLVELKGLTEREAGEILGRKRSTVSEMRRRGLKKLRQELSLASSC
jgi:RNA polymerase sigma factor (sigma-70 family)